MGLLVFVIAIVLAFASGYTGLGIVLGLVLALLILSSNRS
jgi:hypothetical protein